jgi:hypothetical protein
LVGGGMAGRANYPAHMINMFEYIKLCFSMYCLIWQIIIGFDSPPTCPNYSHGEIAGEQWSSAVKPDPGIGNPNL